MKRYRVTFKGLPEMKHLGLGTVLESFKGSLFVDAVTDADAQQKAETIVMELFSLKKRGLGLMIFSVHLTMNREGLPD
jgi:hypothetical protein